MYYIEIFLVVIDIRPKLAQFQEIKENGEKSVLEIGRNVLPHVNDKPLHLLLLDIAIAYQMVYSVPRIHLVCDFILTQIFLK